MRRMNIPCVCRKEKVYFWNCGTRKTISTPPQYRTISPTHQMIMLCYWYYCLRCRRHRCIVNPPVRWCWLGHIPKIYNQQHISFERKCARVQKKHAFHRDKWIYFLLLTHARAKNFSIVEFTILHVRIPNFRIVFEHSARAKTKKTIPKENIYTF